MAKYEPTRFEVIASFNVNTALARAIYPVMTWTSYDRHQAHTWALRLIHANPQNGEDCAAALVNFDYMVEGARGRYRTCNKYRAKYDEVFALYAKWATDNAREVAA
jgi:hypothetical protein